MDNQQIHEILENLMKERKETPVQNVVSQENIDLLIEKYYQEQKEKEDKS
jgi:hypothetical protein